LLGAFDVVEAAVTFLALLHNLVAAKGSVTFREAIRLTSLCDGVQHGRDVGLGARRELIVVVSVAGGGRGEHDVVAAGAAWSTVLGVIMLQESHG
jgi:hypothetical protein